MKAIKVHENIVFKRGINPHRQLRIGKDLIKNKIIAREIEFVSLSGYYYIKILKNIYSDRPEYSGYADFYSEDFWGSIKVASEGDTLEYEWDGYEKVFGSRKFTYIMDNIWNDKYHGMPPGIDEDFFVDNPDSWEFEDETAIKESVSFKRGGDPHKQLVIGDHSEISIERKRKEIEKRVQITIDYYNHEDFKDQYQWHLMEYWNDAEETIIKDIEKYMNAYEWEGKYGVFDFDNIKFLAPKIYEYIGEHLEDFTSGYTGYYVGYTSLINVEYGEQEEEIEKSEIPYYEAAGYYVSPLSNPQDTTALAYYIVSGGLHIDLLNSDIPFDKLYESSSVSVGIGAGGSGGYGSNNILTPQSQRGYAHQREEEEDDEEWLDLEDLSGEFMDEAINFKRGGNLHKQLGIGDYREFKVGKGIVFLKSLGYKNHNDRKTGIYHVNDYFVNIRSYQLFTIIENDDKFIYIRHYSNEKSTTKLSIEWLEENSDLFKIIEDPNLDESVSSFKRGEDPYKKLNIGKFRDKNADILEINDPVYVDATTSHYEFSGMVVYINMAEEYCIVEDMEGDNFTVESENVEKE